MKLSLRGSAKKAFTSLLGGLILFSPLSLAQRGAVAQTLPPELSNTGAEVLQDLIQCTLSAISGQNLSSLEAASLECLYEGVILTPDGKVRPDVSQRLGTLVQLLGVTLPVTQSQGQASVSLQTLADSSVWTLPVRVNGKSETFLLDTGASNSIFDRQILQQLNVSTIPISEKILAYMVVGENCSEANATMSSQPLPALTVDGAKVEGIMGLGLTRDKIPGNVAGVLGLDFLKGFDLILNPRTRQLQLLPASASSSNTIPLKGALGVMTAEAKINEQGAFTFLLDTGADTMVLSQSLAQRLNLDLAKAENYEVTGFCGTAPAKKLILDRVSVGEHSQRNLEAVILDDEIFGLLGIDGIVGQNFLNQYRQHWRFGKPNELGFPTEGSLILSPL